MNDTTYQVGLVLTADGKGLRGEVKLSKEELKALGFEARKAERPIRATGRALNRTGREARGAATDFQKAERATGGLTRSMGGLRGATKAIGFALLAREVGQFIGAGIRAEKVFENLEKRVTFFTRSQADTAREFAFAREQADELGVSEAALIESRARLLPMEKAGVLARQQALDITTGLIDASKALGAEQQQLGQVMFGLSQALSSSIVKTEEFNQVTEPLSGIVGEMDAAIAEMTDGANRNFREMIKNQEVSADLFARVLIQALKSYEGAAASSLDTVDGRVQTLSNSWTRLQRNFTDTSVYKYALKMLKDFVDSGNRIIENGIGDPAPSLSTRFATAQIDREAARLQYQQAALGLGFHAAPDAEVKELERRYRRADDRVSTLSSLSLDIEHQVETIASRLEAEDRAKNDLRIKQIDAANARLDAAPQSIDQKAEKIRGFIKAIRADVEAGLTEADTAAPAIAAYEAQLQKLLKSATGSSKSGTKKNPIADLIAESTAALLAGTEDLKRAGLDRQIALDGQAGLQRFADELGDSLGIDVGGITGFAEIEAGAAAVHAMVDALEDMRASLADSGIKLNADGLPADPGLRSQLLGNAALIAEMAGEEERARLQVELFEQAEKDRAQAAEDAAEAHKKATETIAGGLIALQSPYDQAIAAAEKWRKEALAGLDPDAEGFDQFKADAEAVYAGQLAQAREDQAERERAAIGGITAALTSLKSPYEQAVTAAKKWREETREALTDAGVDAALHAGEIEAVYAGRIAKAEEDRAERQRQALSTIDQALGSLAPSYERSVADADEWAQKTAEALTKAGLDAELYAAKIEEVHGLRIAQAYEDELQRRTDWAAGIERSLLDIADETADFASVSEKALKDFSRSGEDAFTQLATKGKFEIGGLVDTVLADLARLAYRQSIAPAANGLFSSLLGSVGSLFGGGSGLAASLPSIPIGVFHSGGDIGGAAPATRMLDLGLGDIARAPRLHDGGDIGADERLIVGQVGEKVFTPRQFDNMAGMVSALAANAQRPIVIDGGAGKVEVRVAPELQVRQRETPGGGVQIDVARQFEQQIASSISAGRSPITPALQSRFALQPNFSGRR